MKTTKTGIINSLIVILLIFSIILGMYAVWIFMNGYHNADLGQNIRVINAETHQSYVDRITNNEVISGTELYILGLNQMRTAFAIFGVFCFLMGISLCKIIKL